MKFRLFSMYRSAASVSLISFLLLLLLTIHHSTVIEASTSSSSSSSPVKSNAKNPLQKKPPFVSHVDRDDLQEALAVAKQRHMRAVQKALENYNVDALTGTDNAKVDQERLDTIVQMDAYEIDAPGALADFSNELPRTVYCTHASNPLFTREECAKVIEAAETHFRNKKKANGEDFKEDENDETSNWTMQQSGQYKVAGFYIKDIPAVEKWFTHAVKTRLFPLLARTFPDFVNNDPDGTELCVDNAYLFKYTAETGRRTDVHTDSGCLSFTISLNPKEEYTGGGTWFEGLQKKKHQNDNKDDANDCILEMDVGQVTVRPGGVKHCGHAVHSGTRYIIGGFCMHRHKYEPVRMLLTPPVPTTDSDEVVPPTTEEERKALEAAVALNPQCDVPYNLLANHYEAAGDKAKAQQVLEYCLEHVHPGSGEVAYSLGSIYMEQGEYAKAVRCMSVCLQADDCDIDAMMTMAQASADLGDTATEREYYSKIVATPGASAKIAASAYCNLGVLSEGTDQEIHYYRQSLALAPDRFAPQYSLACALSSRGKWKQAVEAFKQSIKLSESKENEVQALQNLYRAAMQVVRLDASPPTSQEDMTRRFKDIMGPENFSRLAATR